MRKASSTLSLPRLIFIYFVLFSYLNNTHPVQETKPTVQFLSQWVFNALILHKFSDDPEGSPEDSLLKSSIIPHMGSEMRKRKRRMLGSLI